MLRFINNININNININNMKLINGSHYNIFNVSHTIREDLIIKEPIPMTEQYKLERLYLVIKYITEFLEENEIDYCIESGTLLGCVRHEGIIPWDNDLDIMIFKDGYFKLKKLINKYTNEHHTIVNTTPGYKIFYDNDCYGELFVYDFDEKMDLYRMAYPYINHYDNQSDYNQSNYNNDLYIPTFLTSDIYYNYQIYKKDSLFPTKKTLFEDFYVRTPNNIIDILNNTYKCNLLECIYDVNLNNQHEKITLKGYKRVSFIEKLICNKILIFIYIILHWLVNKFITRII
jgi:phosphorylcholine metabolism protein LicD